MDTIADRFISHRTPDDEALNLYNTKLELFASDSTNRTQEDVDMQDDTKPSDEESEKSYAKTRTYQALL